MKKQYIPFGDAMGIEVAFSKVIAVNITETKKMAWVAGTVALDESGKVIGKGDIAVQTEQVIKNIRSILQEVGGELDDIVTMTCFVKSYEGLEEHHKVRLKYFNKPYPASTVVPKSDFAIPDLLLEINATAIIDLEQ